MGAILGGAAIVGGSSLLGGLLSAGKKVKVPELKPIDFEGEQKKAISQNIASLQSATELAQKTTAAEQSQLEQQLRRAIPGYDQLISQAGTNIGAALRGEVSQDVQSQLQRSAAGRALGGGFGGGTGMGRNLSARDFGLTSMQIQNQGLNQAQNFIQQQRTFGMVQPFSVSSMFVTPGQRIGFMQQQQSAQYGRDFASAQANAMADPRLAAVGSAISQAGGLYGGAKMQQGLSSSMMKSYEPTGRSFIGSGYGGPQDNTSFYSPPPGGIGGPNDPSNW